MDQKARDELLKLFQGKLNQAMRFYLETCSRCGVCTKACHVHESMPHVKYIAALARLHLEEEEVQQLTSSLEDILRYIGKLEKLDVSQVEPTSHVLALKNVFRKDEITPSLTQKDSLSISIAQDNGSFKVPQVIE